MSPCNFVISILTGGSVIQRSISQSILAYWCLIQQFVELVADQEVRQISQQPLKHRLLRLVNQHRQSLINQHRESPRTMSMSLLMKI